jgi:hypothetical protein
MARTISRQFGAVDMSCVKMQTAKNACLPNLSELHVINKKALLSQGFFIFVS